MHNFTSLGLAIAALSLTACSAPTGQDIQLRFQETSVGQKLTSPEALELREKMADGLDTTVQVIGEAALTVSDKWRISKFPPMQPVIVRYGTGTAKDLSHKRRNANHWDSSVEHNYMLELPNGERMLIRQAGPQFHENQMATLVRHSLNVTLVP